MLRKWFAFPVARIGVITILVLVLLMAFPTTRALAGDLLNLFRVQQVVILPIDSIGIENMNSNKAFGSQLSQLISSSTIVTDEPDEPVLVTNAKEASAIAGFTVRLPKGKPTLYISVTDSAAFTMMINRTKAQNLLDGAGRSDLILAEDIDGAEISINIPSSVRTAYGTCPEPSNAGNTGNSYPDCIIFSQLPSPVVNVPENLDITQLAQIGLELSGMNLEEAKTFTSSVDWTTTLVIPIPLSSSTYEDVIADGIIGKLIKQGTDNGLSEYVLLWVKGGIVYFINGSGTDISQALEISNTLP